MSVSFRFSFEIRMDQKIEKYSFQTRLEVFQITVIEKLSLFETPFFNFLF